MDGSGIEDDEKKLELPKIKTMTPMTIMVIIGVFTLLCFIAVIYLSWTGGQASVLEEYINQTIFIFPKDMPQYVEINNYTCIRKI